MYKRQDKVNTVSTSLISNPLGYDSNFIIKKSTDNLKIISRLKIIPPQSLLFGLLIAICGHSFWNGSGIIISKLGFYLGFTENAVIGISLVWIIIMVTIVIFVSSLLMRGISSLAE